MARRRHLITYDITDPRRLRRVCHLMEGYGQRLQYSVFLCDLSGAELAHWETDIRHEIDLAADSVIDIDLGPTNNSAGITMLGAPRHLPHSGPTIV